MPIQGKKIGVALTGSFCTYSGVIPQIRNMADLGADITAIYSNATSSTNSRFGNAVDFMAEITSITGNPPILTISDAEPIGPRNLLDVLIILPCTGNTLAKLANGITDSPVLMAAKAHLRNEGPLVIFLSTNDALGINMKNIGTLMSTKNVFFVPFGQDNPVKKHNSMISHFEYLVPAIENALDNKQVQPVVISPFPD